MAREAFNQADLYFQAKGLHTPAPESLAASLRLALDDMRSMLFSPSIQELTAAEQEVLQGSGLDVQERKTPDPLLGTAAKFAAILESSLTPAQTAPKLGVSPGRLRQLVADRSLYSLSLDGHRFIPLFQFMDPRATRLVPNIGPVNQALDPTLHPVEVLNWYTTPNPDLFVPSHSDMTLSPLAWLKTGYKPEAVVHLAASI